MLWSVGGITYFLTEVVSCNWDLVHLLLVGIDGSGFIKTSLSAHIVCGTFLSDKTLCSVSVTQEDNLELFQKGFDSWSKILCPMWGPYLCQGWSALCCSMIVAILSIGFKLPLHDFLSCLKQLKVHNALGDIWCNRQVWTQHFIHMRRSHKLQCMQCSICPNVNRTVNVRQIHCTLCVFSSL